ncbi:hypothetical protein MTP99_010540 [Tenebrio molitor]|nr:hypothetical protein MTP99_010540 [Tenebrio molitor]
MKSGINFASVDLVFNCEIFFSLSCFMYLAPRWHHIMSLWSVVDLRMDQSYSYPKYFNLKIKIIFVIYSLMSIGNHVGSPMHSILSLFVTHEYHSKEFTFLPQFDNIFSKILTLHSILGKTTMHFRDIFIVFISIMLRESFKQINKRIRENGECIRTEFWKEIREDYDRLANLTKRLNEGLGYLIIVSAGCNGFWILNFFYRSYTVKFNSSANLYFLYPFIYILIRFVMLFGYSALLNDESLKTSTLIQFSKLPILNPEICRLLTQIEFDNVYLSGCKIFKMKKGVVLSVSGAIVAYELTLLQYNVFSS